MELYDFILCDDDYYVKKLIGDDFLVKSEFSLNYRLKILVTLSNMFLIFLRKLLSYIEFVFDECI